MLIYFNSDFNYVSIAYSFIIFHLTLYSFQIYLLKEEQNSETGNNQNCILSSALKY